MNAKLPRTNVKPSYWWLSGDGSSTLCTIWSYWWHFEADRRLLLPWKWYFRSRLNEEEDLTLPGINTPMEDGTGSLVCMRFWRSSNSGTYHKWTLWLFPDAWSECRSCFTPTGSLRLVRRKWSCSLIISTTTTWSVHYHVLSFGYSFFHSFSCPLFLSVGSQGLQL